MNISKRRAFYCFIVFYNAVLITSCHQDNKVVDVSGIPLEIQARRFEQDLFKIDTAQIEMGLHALESKYGDFFYLYAYPISGLGSEDSLLMYRHFRDFLADTNMLAVYQECENQYGRFDELDAGLTDAFRRYKYFFPEKQIPKILTMISIFGYPVAVDSNHLAIGLDMYLGPEYKYYFTTEPPMPNYIRSRMRKEYILADVMKGWLMSDYDESGTQNKLVESIIAKGRIVLALDYLLPKVTDTLKTGYTAKQLEWCRQNESGIWSFFIDQKLLFSDDASILAKYTNDGPTTNGFPKESPGNIGLYIGMQIARAYMNNHPAVSIRELLEEKDLQKIFRDSRYKPAKNNT